MRGLIYTRKHVTLRKSFLRLELRRAAAMPANLPPQYSKAEEEYRKATTPAERLEKLREMFRLLPKHKGTEKLQSDLKQKISRTAGRDRGGEGGGQEGGRQPPRAPRRGRPGRPGRARRTRARARCWRP